VTGTPIQNRLTDLYSLVRFLQISPFDDRQVFDTQILRPWQTKSDVSAVYRLILLVKCIAIRRSKALLQLPPRSDQIRRVDFSDGERNEYEALRLRIKGAAFRENTFHGRKSYFHVLRWIDDLRTLCSYGTQAFESRSKGLSVHVNEKSVPLDQENLYWREEEQNLEQAGSLLEPGFLRDVNPSVGASPGPDQGVQLGELDDHQLPLGLPTPPRSQHSPLKPSPSLAMPPSSALQHEQDTSIGLSTKIAALMTDLVANKAGKR
jgi:SNF2-related domain